jgi:hypothetical protein
LGSTGTRARSKTDSFISAMLRGPIAHFTENALSRITYALAAILRLLSIGGIGCGCFLKKTAPASIKKSIHLDTVVYFVRKRAAFCV